MTETPQQSPQTALREAFDQCRELIQEAKGADGPNGGFVTDHLDFAETWLNKAEAMALAERPAIEREAGKPLKLTMPNGEILECEYPDSTVWARSWSIRYPDTGQIGTTGEQDWEIVERYGLTAILEAALLPARSEPLVDGAAEVRRLALEDAAKVARAQAEWERELATKPGVGRKAAANHNGAAAACEQVEAAIQALADLAPDHFMSARRPDHVGGVETGKGESDRG